MLIYRPNRILILESLKKLIIKKFIKNIITFIRQNIYNYI